MSIREIKNYLQVNDFISSSGQPDEMDFKWIAAEGFDLVINLAMPNSTDAIPEEGNIVTARGMSYCHIPVPIDAPNAEHLERFLLTMSAWRDRKVWVHCVVNYRVSAFLYQYCRLSLGYSSDSAKKAMVEGWRSDDVWQRFIELSEKDVAI